MSDVARHKINNSFESNQKSDFSISSIDSSYYSTEDRDFLFSEPDSSSLAGLPNEDLESDDVFMGNEPNGITTNTSSYQRPKVYRQKQIRSTGSVNSRRFGQNSGSKGYPGRRHKIIPKNSVKAARKKRVNQSFDSHFESIQENEETNFPHSRSQSNPILLKKHPKNRLERRRSAVTFPSTYRTLSSPAKFSPARLSTTSSLTPSAEISCSNALFNHKHGTWSLLQSCLDQKKVHGTKFSTTQVAIRKSLEKAIQKAGYSMNELAVSGSSPMGSPVVKRRIQQKCEVDWTENASISDHIWGNSNASGEMCYVGEDHCMKTGARKKCSACRIVVHEQCIEHLNKIGFQCKTTFREVVARSSRENIIVRHHWVHRRKQEGKCKQCNRSFERRFGFRDTKIIAISCSWCKDAYHNKVSCFQMHKISEPCNMGIHSHIIVPPNWIVKHTQRQKSVRNRSKKKRNSGTFNRKRSTIRDSRQKIFSIRPLLEHTPYLHPTIVFINPKSGGNQGAKLLQNFHWLLNPRQVFDLSNGGPKEALEMFRKVPNLRILACGGDGTVGWILSVLDELNYTKLPPVAILPLGTGNDLSRTLNWGPGYSDEPITKILQHVEEGKVVQLDRWKLTVTPNNVDLSMRNQDDENDLPNEAMISEGVNQPPLHVVNNYFSIGSDAQVSLEFHQSREAHPSKFQSRLGNKMFYVRSGISEYLTRQTKNLYKHIKVVCDGVDITQKIREIKPVCILFLNILKYSAGFEPWGNPQNSEFKRARHNDKLIEVLAFTPNQLGMMYVGGHGERLFQCREAHITTGRVVPIQIDGEPCKLNPSNITLSFLNQANVILKSKRANLLPAPDSLLEKQKVCVNSVSMHQYELFNGDREKLVKISSPVVSAMIPCGLDLKTARLTIEEMLEASDMKTLNKLSENWNFLDFGNSEKFFPIDPSQENLHPLSNVAQDGLLFVLDTNSNFKSQDSKPAVQKNRDRITSDSHLTAMIKTEMKMRPSMSTDETEQSSKRTAQFDTHSLGMNSFTSVEADDNDVMEIGGISPPEVAKFASPNHCDGKVINDKSHSQDQMKETKTKSPKKSKASTNIKKALSSPTEITPNTPKIEPKSPLTKSKSENSKDQITLTDFVRITDPTVLSRYVESMDEDDEEILVETNNNIPLPKLAKEIRNCENREDCTEPVLDIAGLNLNQNHSNNKHNPEKSKWTKVLLDASKRGHILKLKQALDKGAVAIAFDSDGCTAMHNAARFNHPSIIEYLVENGLRNLIYLRDKTRKQTALHKAAWFGNFQVCKLLVEAGSSLTATDYKGMTPLGHASQLDDKKLEEYLMHEACKQNHISPLETNL